MRQLSVSSGSVVPTDPTEYGLPWLYTDPVGRHVPASVLHDRLTDHDCDPVLAAYLVVLVVGIAAGDRLWGE